jgi:hypothetical protein
MPEIKGFIRSTGIFVLQTVKHWLLWISAGLASLTSWATYVYNIPAPAHRYAYTAAGILLVMAFCWTFHLTLTERDQLLEDRKPKFAIVFEPQGHDGDKRPYLQTLQLTAVRQPIEFRDRTTTTVLDRRYRVGVRNLSSATVPSVSVTLQDCKPGGNFIHLNHKLLVMDTEPHVGQADLPPSASGEPTLFFDVVSERGEQGTNPSRFLFCYANEKIQGLVDSGNYEITLRAEGGNVSATKRFKVRKSWSPQDGPGKLMMEES